MKEKRKIFEELIDAELPKLRTAAYCILGNCHDADEAVQNALLKAWQKFDSFRSESKLTGWVYRIAVNEAYEIIRKCEVEKKYAEKYAKELKTEQVRDDSGDEEHLSMLRHAITLLPALYREAIVVGMLSDLSSKDAALRLGCSSNTLYQRIHKAKSLLKVKMERI